MTKWNTKRKHQKCSYCGVSKLYMYTASELNKMKGLKMPDFVYDMVKNNQSTRPDFTVVPYRVPKQHQRTHPADTRHNSANATHIRTLNDTHSHTPNGTISSTVNGTHNSTVNGTISSTVNGTHNSTVNGTHTHTLSTVNSTHTLNGIVKGSNSSNPSSNSNHSSHSNSSNSSHIHSHSHSHSSKGVGKMPRLMQEEDIRSRHLTSMISQSLDWRDENAVTSVRDQGMCGTCASFATTAICESSLILSGKVVNNGLEKVDLSEQYLLRCTVGNDCSGGYIEFAIDRALSSGLPYETEYPYDYMDTSKNGICIMDNTLYISAKSRVSYYNVDDDLIINLLQLGPLAVAVSSAGWEFYSEGIFNCYPNRTVDHAAQLIGYNETAWLLKNSWGTNFGMDGFIFINRSREDFANCGIGISVHSIHASRCLASLLLLLAVLLALH